ncbi:MAG: hypothetical protein Q9162_005603 [Coniocarpon cinnabarinum]
MAKACINYLCRDEFDRPFEALGGAVRETPDSVDTGSLVDPQQSPDIIINLSEIPFLRDEETLMGQVVDDLQHKYCAYQYAALHCTSHMSTFLCMESSADLPYSLLRHRDRLCFGNWLRVFAELLSFQAPTPAEMERPLILASYHGWHKVVQDLISSASSETKADVEVALFWALSRAHEPVVHALMYAHDPATTKRRRPPYTIAAAQTGAKNIVEAVLSSNSISTEDLNAKDEYGRSALHCAAELNHSEILTMLLANPSIRPDTCDRSQKIALHYAAECGSIDAAKVLVSRSASFAQYRDGHGRTTLMYAAENGFLDMVKLLSPYAVSINDECDYMGRSCLAHAMISLNADIAQYLVAKGATLGSKDASGRTCFSNAINATCPVDQQHRKLLLCSLVATYDTMVLDEPDDDEWSPLFWALDAPGYPDIVEALVRQHGVDINRRDRSGRTPLSWAAAGGFFCIVDLLIQQRSIDVMSADVEGKTALSYAAIHGQEATARALVRRAPHLRHARDSGQRRPADWAKLNGHEDFASWLS